MSKRSKPTQQRSNLLINTLIALTLTLAACGGASDATPTPTAAPQRTLTISGSGTATSILKGIAPAFEADVPGYKLDVLSGSGTGGGVQGLLEGLLDVAAMARPPKDEEAAQGIEYVEFGQSGVAVYTHPGVGVANLTSAQLVTLLSGQISNWTQVGGADIAVTLYVRDEGDSSTKALRQVFFDDTPFPETAQVLTSQSDMQAAIAGTVGSVGFGSWPSALAAGAEVSPVALDGVAPGDPAYPMLSPVGIGYLATHQADVQPLIDWLLSEHGQEALRAFDVVTTPSSP